MSLPRMVTWGEFRDRSNGRRFLFVNTHFPHRREDEQARTECANVIAARLDKQQLPVLMTGDFNTGPDSESHRILTAPLRDAWTDAPTRSGPEGTFHGFTGKPGAQRIDWILYRGELRPLSVHTITANRDGRYPSDHFPVRAVLEWRR